MSPVDRTPRMVRGRYWRSFTELEGSSELETSTPREPEPPVAGEPADSPSRRRFLQVMGASMALAAATAGCRWERDQVLPDVRRPPGRIPGEVRHFSTSMELYGVATGLTVTSHDGRPIKVEGNPLHPDSEGATNVFHQASVLGLYDPDRSTGPLRRHGAERGAAPWTEFDRDFGMAMARLRAAGGRGLAVLGRESSSPSLRDLRARLAAAMPESRWYEWEPLTRDAERIGARLAFGRAYRPLLRLERAEVIVCLDADPLVAHPAAIANARGLMRARRPETGRMARVYAIESCFSATGVIADHRLGLRSELIMPLAMALDAAITARAQPLPEHGPAQPRPEAEFLGEPKVASFLATVAKDLLAHIGRGVVLAGPRQPPEVHALCHRINVLLGNAGATVEFLEDPAGDRPTHLASLRAIVAALEAGKVDTLLILGGNPVYDTPVDLAFGPALAKARFTVHASLTDDETSARVDWHVPLAHYLEAWGDGLAYDGTLTLAQPLIGALYGGRSELELVAAMIDDGVRDGLAILRRTHAARLGDDRGFARAVQRGLVGGPMPLERPTLLPFERFHLTERQRGGLAVANGALELTFGADTRLLDGRFANNGWLQELPDPFTKLTWDNAALVAPRTAQELGVADGSLVTLEIGGRTLELPAVHAPGQAPGSIYVPLGYGRTRAGLVGGAPNRGVTPVGADTYGLRSSGAPYIAAGLTLRPTGDLAALAPTQHLHTIDAVGRRGEAERLPMIVREATLAEIANPTYTARDTIRHPSLASWWQDPVSYEGRRWGMGIDLTKCIGCNACVVACTAENNVPVVGKEMVQQGREMHWIRIDRYFRGPADNPEITFQPVACQHCENAPCEQVCPVGATVHSSEGLNDMVYNRCIGTRYCSNNCPYKVRRYNYFNQNLAYADARNQVQRLVLNPEVTVRSRGVMEKCTFCVQRIQRAKISAKNERRSLADGDVATACQQACPTQAIVFGDLNDRLSRVVAERQSSRTYELLGELNNRPRVAYLARVRNPHPDLAAAAAVSRNDEPSRQ
ncbi:MAG: TAT-variant-translocated molybdopterin oxidoreductase [Polyangiaceae bacterium]|nr:TAT-variant-translocated molybdopterin oxidoreductase [Polyangiaceae bacterium]